MIDIFEKFIEEQASGSKGTYRDRIKWFESYFTERGLNNSNEFNRLSEIKRSDIFASLDLFIINSRVKKQSVAFHYVSVVRSFIDFLTTMGIHNDELNKEFGKNISRHDSFHYAVKEKITNDQRLEKSSALDPFEQDEIQLIKVECYAKVMNIHKITAGKLEISEYEYNSVLGYTCLRLACFVGAKPKLFNVLTIDDLDSSKRQLTVNGYKISLTDDILEMINCYMECRNKIKVLCNKLFVRFDGSEIQKDKIDNSYLHNRLTTIIGVRNTTGITKYVIIEMIKRRMTQYEIKAITFADKGIYNFCLKLSNIHEESNNYVNEILREIDTL